MKKLSFAVLPVALAIAGCANIDLDRKVDYRSAEAAPSLEVPPDIHSPVFDNKYTIPPSTLAQPNTAPVQSTTTSPTATPSPMPQGNDVATVVRDGQQRWIVAKLPPKEVWKIAREFWTQTGFVLKEEQPDIGLMETDWAENRAKIPQDFIRKTIGKIIDVLYSTAERDKFKTRLEQGIQPGTTNIYITHKGMAEVADSATDERVFKWQPRPSDPELEAEMLQRLALKINHPDANFSKKSEEKAADHVPTKELKERAHLIKGSDGIALDVDDSFESTWQRTSIALEHLGFTVEDYNRQQGLFMLRYNSEVTAKDKNWKERLSFWKPEEKTKTATYRLRLLGNSDHQTRLIVESAEHQPAANEVAEPILKLLQEHLR